MIYIADAAKLLWLDAVVSGWSGVTVHLWKNNRAALKPGDTVTSFVEADFDGYAPQGIRGWNQAEIQRPGIAIKNALGVRFTLSADSDLERVYGHYYTDASGRLLWAEEFQNPPVTVQDRGDFIAVFPQIGLMDQGLVVQITLVEEPTPTPTPTPPPTPPFAFETFLAREAIGSSPEGVP